MGAEFGWRRLAALSPALGCTLGEGAALRWEPAEGRDGRVVYRTSRSLIPGCFAGGGGGVGSARLCVPLPVPLREPTPAPSVTGGSGRVGDAGGARVAFEKSPRLQGEASRERSPRQVILGEGRVWRKIQREGVPGRRGAGEAGGRGSEPARQKRSERRRAQPPAGRPRGSPRSLRPQRAAFGSWESGRVPS